MTLLISSSSVTAPAVAADSVVLAPTTAYENLIIQLTATNAVSSTASLSIRRPSGSQYRISPTALVVAASGANVLETTLPGLNPGESLVLNSASGDGTGEIQVLVWGKLANPRRA